MPKGAKGKAAKQMRAFTFVPRDDVTAMYFCFPYARAWLAKGQLKLQLMCGEVHEMQPVAWAVTADDGTLLPDSGAASSSSTDGGGVGGGGSGAGGSNSSSSSGGGNSSDSGRDNDPGVHGSGACRRQRGWLNKRKAMRVIASSVKLQVQVTWHADGRPPEVHEESIAPLVELLQQYQGQAAAMGRTTQRASACAKDSGDADAAPGAAAPAGAADAALAGQPSAPVGPADIMRTARSNRAVKPPARFRDGAG
jgi:hypothetical protein